MLKISDFWAWLGSMCWIFEITCWSCCLYAWIEIFLEYRHQNIIYLINCCLAEHKGFITWLNSRILVDLVKELLGCKTYITEVTWPRWKSFYLTQRSEPAFAYSRKLWLDDFSSREGFGSGYLMIGYDENLIGLAERVRDWFRSVASSTAEGDEPRSDS
jgi:hypothetical protein